MIDTPPPVPDAAPPSATGTNRRSWFAGYVVSFLFPGAGFWLWLLLYTRPDMDSRMAAGECLTLAIISGVLWTVLFILFLATGLVPGR